MGERKLATRMVFWSLRILMESFYRPHLQGSLSTSGSAQQWGLCHLQGHDSWEAVQFDMTKELQESDPECLF